MLPKKTRKSFKGSRRDNIFWVDHGGEEKRAQVRTRKEVNAASPIVRVVQMLKDE